MKSHNAQNKVLSLTYANGNRITDYELVKQEAINFYKHLFSEPGMFSEDMKHQIERIISRRLSATHQANLQREISNEEIKHALFSMREDTAPGLDGFAVDFYKADWAHVEQDFINAIKRCFYAYLPSSLNSNSLTLIPKVPNAIGIKEFRSIACYNVVYKCYSKVLTERLKNVLDDLILDKQSAFLKGRSISNNIILMHELVRNCHRRGGKARCVVKIDIMKAYDTIKWDFLFSTLEIMAFRSLVC